ncbi:hypothetical protein RDp07_gp41 [Roseobacter phage RD-1410Ws-07]|uniref:Uncharacterized protein n=2 Tax=Sanyabayvirus DS1410Ws06 TaxID=2844087 RepID=A0A191VYQ7_9CAUD|nr:hypothetical protein HYO98_gp44 [Dinoroseobacter phage DS-1410Ws-06]ANJ20701.1 hypothetical protein DSp06_gp44 [Dinoroseobacter phage DS-1410Ws-06]ANJ20852.1 hypothetical protein RDp07_gp41 [Roseobacter phage RD-1410Ws-07]
MQVETKEQTLSEQETGWRWWLFNKFGPPELRNLVNYIKDLTDDGADPLMMYRGGTYQFHTRVAEGQQPSEPFIFRTEEERYCFGVGLNYGVQICGGQAHAMSEEQFEEFNEMKKKATHGGGNA